MSEKQGKIEHVVREYLLEETTIKKINDPKLDFGFQFQFPPGSDPSGRPMGQNMALICPKGKDLLIISLGTQIAPPHVNALESLKNNGKQRFYLELRKFLLFKNLMFRIDVKNNRYEISEQYFLNRRRMLSKNAFYTLIRNVFSCAAYCQILLNEFCSGKINLDDMGGDKDMISGPGFSLYS